MTYTIDICRAKRLDNGEDVYGYYVKHKEIEICPINFNGETDNDKEPKYKHLIIFDGMADFGMEKPLLSVEIDPATKCRCTGLPDKNGYMIFERDIVRDNLGRNGQIIWDKDCYTVIYSKDTKNYQLNNNILWGDIHVIGNT